MECYEVTFTFTFALHSTAGHNNPHSGHESVYAFSHIYTYNGLAMTYLLSKES